MVLLGGDAGLRLGEIVAVEWRDIDLGARRLTVQRSDWRGHVTVPKGGRSRQLPTTQRYMHLSPTAMEHAIRLLDGRRSGLELAEQFGDILDRRTSAASEPRERSGARGPRE